jgi:hypothetical protein
VLVSAANAINPFSAVAVDDVADKTKRAASLATYREFVT